MDDWCVWCAICRIAHINPITMCAPLSPMGRNNMNMYITVTSHKKSCEGEERADLYAYK